jgi:hypothetical protein
MGERSKATGSPMERESRITHTHAPVKDYAGPRVAVKERQWCAAANWTRDKKKQRFGLVR